MSFAIGLRRGIEKLRRKILGPDAECELYGRGVGNGTALLVTITQDWYVAKDTKAELGRQENQWKFCSDDALDAVFPFVVQIKYDGRLFDVIGGPDAPINSARIWVLRTGTIGKVAA